MEKNLTDRKFEMEYLDIHTHKRMGAHFNEFTKIELKIKDGTW